MRKVSLLILTIGIILFGCTKKELTDIEPNKWEQDIPNYITLDSINAYPIDTNTGNADIYITFDQVKLEQSWDKVSKIRFTYREIGSTTLISSVPFNDGKGMLSLATKNSTTYTFRMFIEFNNGRTTGRTQYYELNTPPF